MTAAFQSFNWLRGVADDKRVSVIHRLILIRLCIHRKKTGECNPGYETLAKELTVGRASVFRAVEVGIRYGWLAGLPDHGGRAKRNFVFTFPLSQQSQRRDGSTVSAKRRLAGATVSGKRANSLRKRPQQSHGESDSRARSTTSSDNGHLTGKENGQRERRGARTLSPDGASLGGKRKRARAAKRRPAKRAEPAAELVTAADDAFQKFAAVYPRKVDLEDARAAFAKAIEGGADPEAVVARAAVYAVERAQAIADGDDRKFTPYPATWLRKKKYDEPYPPGVICDEAGNVVAIEQEDDAGEDDFDAGWADFQRRAGYKEDGSW